VRRFLKNIILETKNLGGADEYRAYRAIAVGKEGI